MRPVLEGGAHGQEPRDRLDRRRRPGRRGRYRLSDRNLRAKDHVQSARHRGPGCGDLEAEGLPGAGGAAGTGDAASAQPAFVSGQREETADVIIVGAGPSGSATAAYLAMAGLDVLLLEKAAFPREKVCGDGLTPRAVRELITLGIPTPAEDGWIKNKGLRVIGGGVRMQIPWPELSSFPDYGLVRPRKDFDETLARHAEKAGVRLLERTSVTGPVLDERTRFGDRGQIAIG